MASSTSQLEIFLKFRDEASQAVSQLKEALTELDAAVKSTGAALDEVSSSAASGDFKAASEGAQQAATEFQAAGQTLDTFGESFGGAQAASEQFGEGLGTAATAADGVEGSVSGAQAALEFLEGVLEGATAEAASMGAAMAQAGTGAGTLAGDLADAGDSAEALAGSAEQAVGNLGEIGGAAEGAASSTAGLVDSAGAAGDAVGGLAGAAGSAAPAVDEVGTAAGGAAPAVDSLSDSSGGAIESFQNMVASATKLVAAITGITIGIGAVKAALEEWTQLAGVQERSEIKLATIMRNVVGAREEEIQALKDQASALQRLTGYGDEQIIAAQAMLGTFKLTTDQIQKLTPALLDMAEMNTRATGSVAELEQVAMQLGRSMTTGAGALTRFGVTLTEAQKAAFDTASQTEKVALLAEILGDNFKGVAEAVGQTFTGQMRGAEAALGDFKEELGFTITKNEEVRKVLGTLTEAFRQMGEGIKGSAKEIGAAVSALASGVEVSFGAIRAVWNTTQIAFKSLVLAINTGIEGLNRAFATVTWGDWSKDFQKAAEEVAKYNKETRDSIVGDFEDMQAAGRTMIDGLESVGAASDDLGQKQDTLAASSAGVAGALATEGAAVQSLSTQLANSITLMDARIQQQQQAASAELAASQARAETLGLMGDEVGKLKELASGQDKYVSGLKEILASQKSQLAQLEQQLKAKADELSGLKDATDAQKAEVQAITDQIAARKTAIQSVETSITTAQAEAEQAQRNILTYGDQAASLAALTAERDKAIAKMREMDAQIAAGKAATDALAAAEALAAQAQRDYATAIATGSTNTADLAAKSAAASGAVADLKAKIDAGAQAEAAAAVQKERIARLNAQVADAARDAVAAADLQVQRAQAVSTAIEREGDARTKHLQNLAAEAKARGDTVTAAQLEQQAFEAEIASMQQAIVVRQAEIEAVKAKLTATIAEAEADGTVTTAEQAKIEAIKASIAQLQAEQAAEKESIRSKKELRDAAQQHQAAAEQAEAATAKSMQTAVGLTGVVRNNYAQLSQKAAEYFDQQMKGVKTIDEWWSVLSDREFNRVKAQFEESAASVARMTQKIQEGKASFADLYQAEAMARSGLDILDEQQLSGLRSAIDSARQKMDDFTESARDGLAALKEEWAELNGQQVEAEQLRAQQRRLELEEQITEAQKTGNTKALESLQQQLTLLNQISAKKIEQAKASEQEAQQQQAATPAPQPQASTSKTVNITFKSGGSQQTAKVVDDAGGEALIKLLQELSRAA